MEKPLKKAALNFREDQGLCLSLEGGKLQSDSDHMINDLINKLKELSNSTLLLQQHWTSRSDETTLSRQDSDGSSLCMRFLYKSNETGVKSKNLKTHWWFRKRSAVIQSVETKKCLNMRNVDLHAHSRMISSGADFSARNLKIKENNRRNKE